MASYWILPNIYKVISPNLNIFMKQKKKANLHTILLIPKANDTEIIIKDITMKESVNNPTENVS